MIANYSDENTIKGGCFSDPRGTLRFVNDFHFEGIKRFYTIQHPDIEVIRAWQGHKRETKYFFVSRGSFVFNWINIDDWELPSSNLSVNSKVLSEKDCTVLIIPPGHVNGFKALEPDSTIIVFSDLTLDESKSDDYRFDVEYWRFENR
ncbi:MAG TPA: hypothetical protein VLH61_09690 [Bacteroidales bacterium]|nr:hypothetical protein [Bacteroidales bacterium]